MTAVLAKGRAFRFRARGWSMAPFIHDGDVICVSPLQEKPPGVGEVVAYIQPACEKLVVHRLVRRRGNDWLILGDNTPEATGERVPDANLIGRVTRIERGGKKVRLGLGPERYLIALFSRTGTILPVLTRMRQVYKEWLQR
jgi:phage repressor protein C with HTH and peptisase S24 domain